jgi:hypothetical protein
MGMSNEPEREIEKTLKAYADKRRAEAGAPLELHPATRKMLQGEAARLHPPAREETESSEGLWAWLRPGTILASLLVLMALACVVVLLIPEPTSQSPGEQAMSEIGGNAQPAEPPASANVPALAQQPVPGKDAEPGGTADLTQNRRVPETLDATGAAPSAQPEDTAQAPVSALKPVISQGEVATMSGGAAAASPPPGIPPAAASQATDSLVAGSPMPQGTARPTAGMVASARDVIESPQEVAKLRLQPLRTRTVPAAMVGSATQRFQRTQGGQDGAAATGSSGEQAVLSSFQVEQTGGELRIVDADGSVYAGFVQKVEDAADSASAANADIPMADVSDKQKAPNLTFGAAAGGGGGAGGSGKSATAGEGTDVQKFYFRVTGLNRSLNQQVLFSGRFSALATEARKTPPSVWDGRGGEATLPLSRAQLRGQALVGGSQMEIFAAPAAP